MSTKAEEFRYWQERSGPKRPKSALIARNGANGSANGKKGGARESLHADRKAAYVLEDTAGRPSRLSTRKSSNRQKTDSQTRAKRWTAEVRPESRAPSRSR
jgi:hypothetical protein